MSERPTPEQVEAHILRNLPATYLRLWSSAGSADDWCRPVDAGLQRLRRKGIITFDRIKDKGTVWRKVDGGRDE